MTWALLIPAGIFFLLLALAAGSIGQRHHLLRGLTNMTLKDELAPLLNGAFDVVKQAVAPLHAQLAAVLGENADLKAKLQAAEQDALAAKQAVVDKANEVEELKAEFAPFTAQLAALVQPPAPEGQPAEHAA